MKMKRFFDDVGETPCSICLQLARENKIQSRAVMPLPKKFPPLSRMHNAPCCHDCEAVDTTQALGIGQHPDFAAARLTIANERCEGLVMPPGLMEHMGLCKLGLIRPCSIEDLDAHIDWLQRHGIPNSVGLWYEPNEEDEL